MNSDTCVIHSKIGTYTRKDIVFLRVVHVYLCVRGDTKRVVKRKVLPHENHSHVNATTGFLRLPVPSRAPSDAQP